MTSSKESSSISYITSSSPPSSGGSHPRMAMVVAGTTSAPVSDSLELEVHSTRSAAQSSAVRSVGSDNSTQSNLPPSGPIRSRRTVRSPSPMARLGGTADELPVSTGGTASRSLAVIEPNGTTSRPQHGTGVTDSRSLVSTNQGVRTPSPNPDRRVASSPSPRPSTLAMVKPKRSRTESPCPSRSGAFNPDTDVPRQVGEGKLRISN